MITGNQDGLAAEMAALQEKMTGLQARMEIEGERPKPPSAAGTGSGDRLAAALDMLKNIVVEVPEAKPRRTPIFQRDRNRLSGKF